MSSISEKYCVQVDTRSGLFVKCRCGKMVRMKSGFPHTLSQWNEHCTLAHYAKLDRQDKVRARDLMKSDKAGENVNKLDVAKAKAK